MNKIRKMPSAKIRKITGGKDPTRLVEEFMSRRGFDVEESILQRTSEVVTWLVALSEEEELEITLEGLANATETTLYMGVNVLPVPLYDSQNFLAAALTVADTLIGTKLSLVQYDLVLSVTVHTANVGVEEVDYFYELLTRQKEGVKEGIDEELEKE